MPAPLTPGTSTPVKPVTVLNAAPPDSPTSPAKPVSPPATPSLVGAPGAGLDPYRVRHDYVHGLVDQARAGSGEAFDSLVEAMQPIIDQRVRHFSRTSSIHPNMLEIDAVVNLQKAVDNWDPQKAKAAGATFTTYARPYIDKMVRTAYEYANIGSIPEHRIIKVNTFKTAKDNLTRRLKRQPSNIEISDELGWNVKEVDRMGRELRSELLLDESVAPTDNLDQDSKDMLHYIRMGLPPDEQNVYERLTGISTGRPMKPDEVAKDLGMDVTQVYNTKQKLAKKIDKILQEH